MVSNGTVSFDELCRDVAEESSLTSGDMKNVMDRLVRSIKKHLEAGRSVDCGEMGFFSINLRSASAPDAETYDAATMMRRPKVNYRAGKLLRTIDSNILYERVTPEAGGEEDDRPVIE